MRKLKKVLSVFTAMMVIASTTGYVVTQTNCNVNVSATAANTASTKRYELFTVTSNSYSLSKEFNFKNYTVNKNSLNTFAIRSDGVPMYTMEPGLPIDSTVSRGGNHIAYNEANINLFGSTEEEKVVINKILNYGYKGSYDAMTDEELEKLWDYSDKESLNKIYKDNTKLFSSKCEDTDKYVATQLLIWAVTTKQFDYEKELALQLGKFIPSMNLNNSDSDYNSVKDILNDLNDENVTEYFYDILNKVKYDINKPSMPLNETFTYGDTAVKNYEYTSKDIYSDFYRYKDSTNKEDFTKGITLYSIPYSDNSTFKNSNMSKIINGNLKTYGNIDSQNLDVNGVLQNYKISFGPEDHCKMYSASIRDGYSSEDEITSVKDYYPLTIFPEDNETAKLTLTPNDSSTRPIKYAESPKDGMSSLVYLGPVTEDSKQKLTFYVKGKKTKQDFDIYLGEDEVLSNAKVVEISPDSVIKDVSELADKNISAKLNSMKQADNIELSRNLMGSKSNYTNVYDASGTFSVNKDLSGKYYYVVPLDENGKVSNIPSSKLIYIDYSSYDISEYVNGKIEKTVYYEPDELSYKVYDIRDIVPDSTTTDYNYNVEDVEKTTEDTTNTEPQNVSGKLGDADGNGEVGLSDVICVAKYVANSTTYPLKSEKNADVSKDGRVDAVDLCKLIEFNLGKIEL